jgi:alpha-tubulin suppressor-like RCC1 family protein
MRFVLRFVSISSWSVVALLFLASRPGAQGSGLTVSPANPTIQVGQTQQFVAGGPLTAIGLSGGGYHTCVLLSAGTVRCAGLNNWGQLGNGTFTSSSTPVAVSGLSGAIGIGNGTEHTCALVSDGTMQCWGTNYVGQLGDGTIGGYSLVPKPVQGLSNVVAAVVGGFHTCAVLAGGSVRCWGRNQDGQVGNGDSTTDVTAPQAVAGLGAVSALSSGGYHTCAVMPDRTMRCWGRNTRGQLGDGTSTSSSTPVAVSGITTAVAVSAGYYHTCALLADGTVRCWGDNDSGQIGNTLVFSSTPMTLSGISNAVAVAAGAYHSCAVLADGSARCWGRNANGQLGDGTTVNSPSPVIVGGIARPTILSGGGLHTCTLMADRSARCWGWNDYGQLANGNTTSTSVPVTVSGTGLTWTSSDPAVATIDATGRATGIGAGTTTITVTDSSGSSASTVLRVGSLETLTVTVSGSGTVTSTPSGIVCGSDCSEVYSSGTTVTLTAAPSAGWAFTGWTGCDSASATTCTVAMSSTRSVSASFARVFQLTVSRAGAGTGSVASTPSGIACGSDCTETYLESTSVTLTASAAAGSAFTGWSGCDSASGATCTVAMSAARSVTATFARVFTLTVTKTGLGNGTVTSAPAGINCGNTCSASYVSDTNVTLTATPAFGSLLLGWSGCDSSSGPTCTVRMSAARAVSVNFLGLPLQP